MKRMSRIICTLALLLMSLSVALPANAALQARSATIDPATGYPTWYQDNNNLALTNCLDQNGFCLAAFTGAALPTLKANISDANFPIESFYYMADTSGTSPGGTISLTLWEAALEAGFAANAVDGGQAVFSRIRIRANVTLPGTYTVTHPYGVNTFEVTTIDPGAHEINFTNDVPGLVPQDFDTAVTTATPFVPPFVGPTFLTNATGAFITDQATGNRYLGLPGAPVTVTGSPFNTNFVRITGPTADTFESTTFGLQGKVIGMDVTPTNNNLGAATIGGAASAPQTVKVTNTTGAVINFGAIAPAQTAGTDFTDFAIAPPTQPTGGLADCATAPLAPTATCGFDVIFTPVAAAKAARTATIVLADTDPAVADPPPVTLNLSGTAQVLVTTEAGANGTITPATGPVDAGSPVIFTVTPSNKKFKVKEVSDATAAATALLSGPQFSINTDAVNHTVTATFMPSGDLDESGALDVADAMKALKIVAGLQTPAADDNVAADVAPLVDGVPAPNNKVDIGDVLVMLRKVIGLDTW